MENRWRGFCLFLKLLAGGPGQELKWKESFSSAPCRQWTFPFNSAEKGRETDRQTDNNVGEHLVWA